jgi:hypothetical protein
MLSWIAIQRKSKCTILFAFTNTCLVHRICRLVKLWSFDQIYGETHVMFNNIINIIRGQMHVHWYYTRTKYRDVSLIQFFASYFNSERTSSFPINFRITTENYFDINGFNAFCALIIISVPEVNQRHAIHFVLSNVKKLITWLHAIALLKLHDDKAFYW